jgi:hypothetical protein
VARYKSKDISFLRRVRTKRRFDSLEEIDKLSNIYKNIKKNSLSVDIIYHPNRLLTKFFLIKIEKCSI